MTQLACYEESLGGAAQARSGHPHVDGLHGCHANAEVHSGAPLAQPDEAQVGHQQRPPLAIVAFGVLHIQNAVQKALPAPGLQQRDLDVEADVHMLPNVGRAAEAFDSGHLLWLLWPLRPRWPRWPKQEHFRFVIREFVNSWSGRGTKMGVSRYWSIESSLAIFYSSSL
eukprot:scaffold1220_cov259-Pinguiococcus_pyrenoidosus.AAC.52